jgi:hypothetical protein
MAKGGRRYPLVVYTRMINRWWAAIFALGLALLGVSWALRSWGFEEWRWLVFISIGALNLFLGVVLFLLRKSAYVQPFGDHLRLVTPFLRLNISYKRFRRASTTNMGAVFPPKSVSNWQAEILEPLLPMTALLIELNGYPMPQSSLRLFLSPLFFKDKTPHLVILVEDWMGLSGELESRRSGADPVAAQQKRSTNSILSHLPKKTNK